MRLQIESCRHRHIGERVWIIGNGPSLLSLSTEERDAIDSELTIGTNKCWLGGHARGPNPSFEGFQRPTYHLCVNGLQAHYLTEHFVRPKGCAFVSRRLRWLFSKYSMPWCPIERARDFDGKRPLQPFRHDIENGFYAPFAGLLAIQLAVFMGFSEVFLLGYDGNDKEGHHYDENPYADTGASRQRLMVPWFTPVAEWVDRSPTRIVNTNRLSAIPHFERASVSELLGERNAA